MVLFVYFLVYLFTNWIQGMELGNFGTNTLKPMLWGFNFLIGTLFGILFKSILNRFKKAKIVRREYINNYMLNRISGFCFDIMIVAGTAAINFEHFGKFLLPFILIVGDWQQLGTSTDSICLKVTPPDVFVSKAQTVNGLTGLLNRTRVSRLCYYCVDNTFSSGSNIYLDGQTGYILRAQVKDTGETPDFTISLTAGITGISQLQVVGDENSPVDVYSTDGRLLRRQVKTSEALCGLLKGIYIVGKRKVVIP
jgi:hypothetical protein